jgi:hypothetical protein
MKTREYVKKYELDKDDVFSHEEFMKDLTYDFKVMLSSADIGNDYGRFKRLIDDTKKKWDNIDKKTVGQLPEKLWGYFYASVVIVARDSIFPHMAAKEEASA